MGKEIYDQKYRYNIQSAFSAEELYQLAIKRKTFIHTEMAKLAKEMWPKYYGNEKIPNSDFLLIRKVLDTLSSQHVKPEEFQSAIEKQIPIVPITIPYNWLILPDDGKYIPVRHLMKLIVHEPIETTGMTLDNLEELKNKTFVIIDTELRKQNEKEMKA